MRIDFLLYYLLLALRDSRMNNTSYEFVAIKRTLEQIKEFTSQHIETNNASLIKLEETCKLDLIDEHHQDQPLLTFLYLSSKDPSAKPENDRFVYEIDESNQSLTMTYDSTPVPFYDKGVRTQAAKIDSKTYRYGPFTKIYHPMMTSRTISEDGTFINAVEDRLRNGEAVTVIGYGASGSGKTTTLVYAKHSGEAGLLARVANRLISSDKGFTSCEVIIYELDADITPLGEDNGNPDGKCRAFLPEGDETMERTVLDKGGRAQKHTLRAGSCFNAQSFSYKVGKTGWVNSKDTSLATEIVEYIDTKRNTAPTPNNPQSSRSHVICVLTFSKGNGKSEAQSEASDSKDSAVFIVCDFAGVENTFICDDPSVKDTIGNNTLIDSMIQTNTQVIYQNMRGRGINNAPENALVLWNRVSSYLFGSDRVLPSHPFTPIRLTSDQIMDRFKRIGDDRNKMYGEMIKIYQTHASKTLPTMQELQDNKVVYHTITFKDYGHGMKGAMNLFHAYADSYMRILDLYRYANDDQKDEIVYEAKVNPEDKTKFIYTQRVDYDLRVNDLLRILVWHIQNSVRYQALFQSLMTLAYQPAATTAMTNSQIREHIKVMMCDQRVKEGVFINRSLAQLRSFISAQVRNRTRTPPFLDECVPLQCDPQYLHCFGQGSSSEKEDGGPLAELIEKSRNGKDNTFCIFTVVNLSRDANNPPPIPYVDISPLLKIYEAWQPLLPSIILTTRPDQSAINAALSAVGDQIQRVRLEGPLIQEYERLQELIRRGHDTAHYLEALIQQFISHNAITTIGTIEFTDAMAKYGATQITCAPMEQNEAQGRVGQLKVLHEQAIRAASSVASTTAAAAVSRGGRTPLQKHLGMPTRVRRKANRRTRKKRNA